MRVKPHKWQIERFWHYVDKSGDCWLWTKAKDVYGYGKCSESYGHSRAHRAAYIMEYGDIPDGLFICHRCDTPSCVRPDHLFAGTPTDNMADAVHKNRHIYGEKSKRSKLSNDKVREIHERRLAGETYASIGKRYGVCEVTIFNVCKAKTWKHMKAQASAVAGA